MSALLRIPLGIFIFVYGTITFYGQLSKTFPLHFLVPRSVLQPQHCQNNGPGLGCPLFARHYWGNHYLFSFLQVLRCFSSWVISPFQGIPSSTGWVAPFGINADQRLFAPPRGLSQPITSFIASESQGIHHTPLIDFLNESCKFGSSFGLFYR